MVYTSQKTVAALTNEGRAKLFGKFTFKPAPVVGDPERIQILGDWAKKNLVTVDLTTLLPAGYEGLQTRATFHRLVAPKFEELIDAWKTAGVLDDLISWNGAHSARYVRGSVANLSAHSWGSAFDINAKYNPLGGLPLPVGKRGSVLRLVPIAEELGWAWGGRFSRSDPMHFELSRL